MKKYPRTYHLPFSPEVHSDDKICDLGDLNRIIDEKIEVVILVKLDGGNACLSKDGVFARTHAQETSCPTFDFIKNVHYYQNLNDLTEQNLKIFGENMFAVHSIVYENLKDYFYVFNILDENSNNFLSHDEVDEWATAHKMQVVPKIYEGVIPSLTWLEKYLALMLSKNDLGGPREGFVIRTKKAFSSDDFSKNVFKYVRKDHVQDKNNHWSRNWVQQPKLVK
jgi:hypothetical protein